MSDVHARVAETGLLAGRVVVLFSGGRDSTALLDLAIRLAGPVTALHVNYRLRDEADADEAHCRSLCARLGVPLEVRRAGAPEGNVQAWARAVRYAEAEQLPGTIAAGHTATDQVETVLYRLAASPGRRALLGMPARSGRLVRPLLGVTREETAAYCEAGGLPWREDSSNAASVRGRLRAELIPLLRQVHPAAEANILRTLELLREEAEALDALTPDVATLDELAALPPAIARLVLQEMAGAQSITGHVDAILALPRQGTAALDLPGGLRAVAEYGRLRIEPRAAARAPADPARLDVPGRAAFGPGVVSAERGDDLPMGDGTLAAAALAPPLEVRAWRPGDRMRPLGLNGSRSLQDLFTDRKVPRAQRSALPVVLSAGEIAWIPGVATGERFRVTAATTDRVRLAWHLHSGAR